MAHQRCHTNYTNGGHDSLPVGTCIHGRESTYWVRCGTQLLAKSSRKEQSLLMSQVQTILDAPSVSLHNWSSVQKLGGCRLVLM